MLMMSALYCIVFLGGWSEGYIFFVIKTIAVAFLIVQARAMFPRYRFDQLMYLCWYIFLPFCISFLIFQAGLCVQCGIVHYSQEEMALEIMKANDAWYIQHFGQTFREE